MSCIFWAIVSFVAALLVFLLVERTPLQSEFIRIIFSLVTYLVLATWLVKAIKAFMAPPDKAALAVEIESSSEKFNSALSSAMEFSDEASRAAGPGTSEIMRRLTVAKVAGEVSEEDIVISLKAFSRKQSALFMLVFVLLAGIWLLISPVEFKVGAARMLLPMHAIAPYSALTLTIEPGDTVVARSDNLQISAIPSGTPREAVVLSLFDPGKSVGNKVEMYPDSDDSSARFVYTLTSLQDSVEYQVSSGKFVSERFSVAVVPRPQPKTLQLTLYQPTYVSSGPVKLAENVGDASVLQGSRVKIEVEADQKLSQAALFLVPGATATCEIFDESRFSHEFILATDTNYSIFMKNEMELANENPVTYSIRVTQDASPTVEILQPAEDVPFPKSKRLDIRALARDDHGVRVMVLYYQVGDRSNLIPLNMKSDMTPVKEYEVDFPWMLDTLPLQPGTKVRYHVYVEDSREPAANTATSTTYLVSMPSMYDTYRGEEISHDEVNRRLEKFMEDQQMRRDALMEAYEQIRHEGKLDYEASQAIESAMQNAEKQHQQAQEIMEQFKQLEDRMQENPFSSPQALERLQQVSELLNEVLDEDTKRMMEQLQQALQEVQLDPSDIEQFEELFQMEDYLKQLDRNIELLKQVREQQKMTAMSRAVEDLLKRQQEIAKKTEELMQKAEEGELSAEEQSMLNDLADQQEKISQELEDLQNQAEEMTKDMSETDLKNNPMMDELKKLEEAMKNQDYQKMSEEISRDMQEQKLDSAQNQQKNMLKFLESLQKNAQQIHEMCSGSQAPQLDLSEFIRRALRISLDQEAVYDQIEGLPGEFLRGQRPEIEGAIDQASVFQVLIRQQGRQLEIDLDKFVKTSFNVDPSAIRAIKGTQSILAETVKHLEDRQMENAREQQQELIRRFNLLAIELMRAQDQANQSSGEGSMSPMQQFQNLTQRQLSLYEQMLKQQNSPQSQQMMQQLKQMSMEQRKVREALEKLMRESREQMRSLGRMDDVMEDMEKLETEILDPDLRRKVAEEQRKIYEKMLRAQKSIRDREEESEERKGTQAREILQQEPEQPLEDMGSAERDLSKDFITDLREDYPEAYRELINDYFRSLNIYGGEQ